MSIFKVLIVFTINEWQLEEILDNLVKELSIETTTFLVPTEIQEQVKKSVDEFHDYEDEQATVKTKEFTTLAETRAYIQGVLDAGECTGDNVYIYTTETPIQ